MVIILPTTNKGLKNLESNLNNDNYNLCISKMEPKQVDLYLPKFSFDKYFELSEILSEMGMKTAFNDEADFSGMTGNKDLKISKVVHKTFIKVEEKGVEAAAATAIVMNRKMGTNTEIEETFKADHPFIFIIKENLTNTILFIGTLEKF
jgi:serpin B